MFPDWVALAVGADLMNLPGGDSPVGRWVFLEMEEWEQELSFGDSGYGQCSVLLCPRVSLTLADRACYVFAKVP